LRGGAVFDRNLPFLRRWSLQNGDTGADYVGRVPGFQALADRLRGFTALTCKPLTYIYSFKPLKTKRER